MSGRASMPAAPAACAAVGTPGTPFPYDRAAARRLGLWVFIAVVSALFMLFGVAYLMRMAMADWQPLRYVPWQLWFSTVVLALASAAWEGARRCTGRSAAVSAALLACGLSLLFLAAQLGAWQAMASMRFTVNGNPASSFFYLLTGLHGLHVGGGLVAAALAAAAAHRNAAAPDALAQSGFAASAALCARYWHFLLLLWLALFALLFLLTPDVVQVLCESVGIRPPQAR